MFSTLFKKRLLQPAIRFEHSRIRAFKKEQLLVPKFQSTIQAAVVASLIVMRSLSSAEARASTWLRREGRVQGIPHVIVCRSPAREPSPAPCPHLTRQPVIKLKCYIL